MGIWWIFHVLHQLPCLSSYKLKLLNTYYSILFRYFWDQNGILYATRTFYEEVEEKISKFVGFVITRPITWGKCNFAPKHPQTELGPGRWQNLIKHGLWKWGIHGYPQIYRFIMVYPVFSLVKWTWLGEYITFRRSTRWACPADEHQPEQQSLCNRGAILGSPSSECEIRSLKRNKNHQKPIDKRNHVPKGPGGQVFYIAGSH